jgi:hypothetical protein
MKKIVWYEKTCRSCSIKFKNENPDKKYCGVSCYLKENKSALSCFFGSYENCEGGIHIIKYGWVTGWKRTKPFCEKHMMDLGGGDTEEIRTRTTEFISKEEYITNLILEELK